MRRRSLALLMAALLCAMLLGAAGHALAHLGHAHDHACAQCPVCLQIAHWGRLLARLGALAVLALLFALAQRRMQFLPPDRRPRRRAATPVTLKVKMTN